MIDPAADALAQALSMSDEEQSRRMRPMRAGVAEFNAYRWAGEMLADGARLRGGPVHRAAEGRRPWPPIVLHA
jgi:trehalose-6-phosphate synthase